MSSGSLAIEIISTTATTAAVVVALWSSQRTQRLQRQAHAIEGRREAATEIARWLQSAQDGILAWHDPDNWRAPPGVVYAETTGIEPGDIVPPSQGRMGPSVEAAIHKFDAIKGLTRLAFGPQHEITQLVGEVIAAIGQVARRGVIYTNEDGATPRDYVDKTFLPLAEDLFEALAETCELREQAERSPRSGVRASDHRPGAFP